jgi:ABC-type transport system involved in multi-copper enzyme maturation permease subunit
MTSLLRADLLKTRKRPMGWSMLAISLALLTLIMVLIARFAPLEVRAGSDFRYPSGLVFGAQTVDSFASLMLIVFGASLVGLEYRFDTWKNLWTRRTGRIPFIISKWLILVLAVVLGIVVVALWSQGLGTLLGVGSGPIRMSLNDALLWVCVTALGWLVAGTSGMLGAVLGRTTVAGIILGVAWSIIDPLVGNLAQLSAQIAWIRDGLYSTASASLLAHAGRISPSPAELSVLHSGVVVAAYLIVPLALAAYVFHKRDMAG